MDDAGRVSRRIELAAGAGLASGITTAPLGPRVTRRIPIKDFRARHRQPIVQSELMMPVYEAYRSKYPPGLFNRYQQTSIEDAGKYLADKARWPK